MAPTTSSTKADNCVIHQRILVAHDDPEIRSHISSVLRKNLFEIEVRDSIDSILSFDSCEKPDVVMCRLAWCDEIEKILNETCPKKHTIQYIQLFGPQSAEIVLKAFHRENHDCLQVPASERSVLLSINRAMERRGLLAKNLRAQRKLERSNVQLEKSLNLLESDAQAGRHMQQKFATAFAHYYATLLLREKDLSISLFEWRLC